MTLLIEICLIFLLISTPLMLGTVQPWSIFIMRITVVIALLAWLLKLSTHQRIPASTHSRFPASTHSRFPASTHSRFHASTHSRFHASTHSRFHASTHPRFHASTHSRFHASTHPRFHASTHHHINVELRTIDLAILAFLGVAAFSTFVVSPYKHQSLDWFTNLTTYTALYFILVNNIKTESQIKRLIRAMLTAGTIAGIYGILRYFNILDILPHSQDPRISSTYYHASHYAGFLVMVTPLVISYFLFSKSLWKTLAFGALSALLIANLALSFSITNLAFVISMIFLIIIIFSLREWQVIVKRLVPAMAIFFLFYLLTLVITSPLLSQYTISIRFGQMANTLNSAINGRIQVWRDGLPVALSHFYSGWGLSLFSDVFSKFRPPHWKVFLNYAHSDYLQIASDMGIIGLGVYLVLIGTVLKQSIVLLKQRYNQGIAVGITVALFAAIIRSLWDSNLFIVQSLSIYFFTLIGLMIVMRKNV